MNPLDYLSEYEAANPWPGSPFAWNPGGAQPVAAMPQAAPLGPNVIPPGPLDAQTVRPSFQIPGRGGLPYAVTPKEPNAGGLRVWARPGLPMTGNGLDEAPRVEAEEQAPARNRRWWQRKGIGGGTVAQNLLWGLAALLSPQGAAEGAAGYVGARRKRDVEERNYQQKQREFLLREQSARDMDAYRTDTLRLRGEMDAARNDQKTKDRLVKVWNVRLATQGKTRDQILSIAKEIGSKYGYDQDTMEALWDAASKAPNDGTMPEMPELNPTAQPGSAMDTGAANAEHTRALTETEDVMRRPELQKALADYDNIRSQIKTRETMTPLQAQQLRAVTDRILMLAPQEAVALALKNTTIDPVTGVSKDLMYRTEHPTNTGASGGGKPSPGVLTWRSEAEAASQKYGVPTAVILGLIEKESSGNPNAANGSHIGLGQFGNAERAKYGGSGPDAIGHYLADLVKQTGSLDRALHFYRNGGLNPAPEPGYASDVMRRSWNYGPDGGKAETEKKPKLPIFADAPSAALPNDYISVLGLSPQVPFQDAVRFERESRASRNVVDGFKGMQAIPNAAWTAKRDALNAKYEKADGGGVSGSLLQSIGEIGKAGRPLSEVTDDPDYTSASPDVQYQMRRAWADGNSQRKPPAKKPRGTAPKVASASPTYIPPRAATPQRGYQP